MYVSQSSWAWLGGFATVLLIGLLGESEFDAAGYLLQCTVPLVVCGISLQLAKCSSQVFRALIAYAFFFSISVTSALGFTQVLTGMPSASQVSALYGLAFYTASLSYWITRGARDVYQPSSMLVANPLLMASGPVLSYFKVDCRSLTNRFEYYGPYLVLGLFLHQVIAAPISGLFAADVPMNLWAALIYGAIFELFVYSNFCGISLVVYGVAGIFGWRIPLNFRQPFSATNIVEFWKGWHLSLSVVLKNLFYLPIRHRFGMPVAIVVVYLASAIWHGVSLNFVAWGFFHACVYICSVRLLQGGVQRGWLTALMILGVVMGRVLFMEPELTKILTRLSNFSNINGVDGVGLARFVGASLQTKLAILLGFGIIFAEYVFRRHQYFLGRNYKFYRLPLVQVVLMLVILMSAVVIDGGNYAVYGQR